MSRLNAGGWGNLHDFRLSADGGSTPASFANGDAFRFAADVTITGTGNAEAGLQVAPWWSSHGDGKFMINGDSGEIAVFGGRLPFYSFTDPSGYSLTYTKGDTIRMGVVYDPHALSSLNPATIEYIVTMGATTYSSGALRLRRGQSRGGSRLVGNAQLRPGRRLFSATGEPGWILGAGNVREYGYSDVPEPATMALLGLGSLFLARRRK